MGWIKLLLACCGAVTLVGCGAESAESYAARNAAYQAAKSECSLYAAKKAIPGGGSGLAPNFEAIAIRELKSCMSSKGFDVDLK